MKERILGEERGQCCLLSSLGGGRCCLLGRFGGDQQTVQQVYLQRLREFRDKVLMQHSTGRAFVNAYYGFSSLAVPPLQRHKKAGELAGSVVAPSLKPLAALASIIGRTVCKPIKKTSPLG